MKGNLLVIGALLCTKTFSQELQLHYDMGKDREFVTTTFEIFKNDALGSTFMFTDIDYNRADGASLIYFEITRQFNIKNNAIDGLNFHIEYNDGFLISKEQHPIGIPISQAALVGFGFPIKIGEFTLHTSYLYKWIRDSNGLDGQFTMVWYQNFWKNRITFRGFIDCWSAPMLGENGKKQAVFLTEPQLMYNINKNLSLGTEIEISKNFVPKGTSEINPTFMLRWVW